MSDLASDILMGVSFFSWIAVYVLAIIRGHIDKTYAIPLPALMANIAWELIYGTIFAARSPIGPYLPLAWLAFDVPILIQVIRYGRREFFSISPAAFTLIVTAGLAMCWGILYHAEIERIRFIGSAFPQDLMMSILFIGMLLARNDARGQSMYIAIFKLLGTGAAMALVAFPIAALSGIEIVTFLSILYFNALYLVLLYAKLRRLEIHPWGRL